jgi:AcrR family transcriptional regulator
MGVIGLSCRPALDPILKTAVERLPMTSQTGTTSASRAPLNRERVLLTAIELADTGGIEALTMRKLGQELGVEAMSLYNHVANKADILNGIFEMASSEIDMASTDTNWKAAIHASAISAYRTFRRHQWAHSLMMSSSVVSPSRMCWMEAVLRSLREAGFTEGMTCHAYHALDSHITGFTLWQASFPAAEDLKVLATNVLRDLPVDEYPYVDEHIQHHLIETGPGEKSEFEFGLDLILDGLERILNTS